MTNTTTAATMTASARSTLAELVAGLASARAAAEAFDHPGLFVICDETTAALTLGPRDGGIGFSFSQTPKLYRLGAATDLAAQWNERNPNNSVAVLSGDEWRAARLAELDELEKQLPAA